MDEGEEGGKLEVQMLLVLVPVQGNLNDSRVALKSKTAPMADYDLCR